MKISIADKNLRVGLDARENGPTGGEDDFTDADLVANVTAIPRVGASTVYGTFASLLLGVGVLMALTGCGSVGVENISEETWLRDKMSCALNSSSLSQDTVNFLSTTGLLDSYEDNPQAVIDELRRRFDANRNSASAAALAELCYLRAKEDDSIKYYMSCILFAAQYFGLAKDNTLSFSPRNYFLTRYFNFSLMEVFCFLKERKLVLRKAYDIPSVYGPITFDAPTVLKAVSEVGLDHLSPVYRLRPYGLRPEACQIGLGVPLAGVINFAAEVKKGVDVVFHPITLMIRVDAKDKTPSRATLEFIDPLKKKTVTIMGKEYPLEIDLTTPLAEALERPALIKGIEFMLLPDEIKSDEGLYMTFEYDPDKIPVVFVHGLMSNPRTWAKAFNRLLGDPVIRNHYQFWLFAYATGDPVLYSAARLRTALLETRRKHSPNNDNPNLDKMLIISHSMGGIVSSLMVKDSDQLLIDNMLGIPMDKLDLTPEQKTFLLDMLVFERLPFIQRVVFISTPHRGSFLADYDIVVQACKYIALPTRLTSLVAKVGKKLLIKMKLKKNDDPVFMTTGVNNLDPDNKTLTLIERLPYATGVKYHTISGDIVDSSPLPGSTDGIVPYWSSHLDMVESEKVVTSGHSVQHTNAGIREIHRILLEHLAMNKSDGTRSQ